jgi:hypothetical protein
MPLIPEVTHGVVDFTNASISPENVLPGDGYASYMKVFRTIEDIHVNAAILGHCTMSGLRNDWEAEYACFALPKHWRSGCLFLC